jgi:phenylpyruvate tautomerase PptA (4-oxalocrotonate tautomerase family)
MPIVNLKLIEGVSSREQKQEMIRRITMSWSNWKANICDR